jgi:hypothetical protein
MSRLTISEENMLGVLLRDEDGVARLVGPQGMLDARRATACWNALEGLTIEQIEAVADERIAVVKKKHRMK